MRQKEEESSAHQGQKSLGCLGKELGQDTWGFPGAWDPRTCSKARVD